LKRVDCNSIGSYREYTDGLSRIRMRGAAFILILILSGPDRPFPCFLTAEELHE
jgi:hypothetical protein